MSHSVIYSSSSLTFSILTKRISYRSTRTRSTTLFYFSFPVPFESPSTAATCAKPDQSHKPTACLEFVEFFLNVTEGMVSGHIRVVAGSLYADVSSNCWVCFFLYHSVRMRLIWCYRNDKVTLRNVTCGEQLDHALQVIDKRHQDVAYSWKFVKEVCTSSIHHTFVFWSVVLSNSDVLCTDRIVPHALFPFAVWLLDKSYHPDWTPGLFRFWWDSIQLRRATAFYLFYVDL